MIDFNIHVDVADDPAAVKFHSVLTTFGYRQHVKRPTHCAGHVLDLILTNSDMPIQVWPIDPPLLSDHSFVVADIRCLSPMSSQLNASSSTSSRLARDWRSLDVDAFVADLQSTDLVVAPPDDVTSAFACYDRTLRALLDKHAPLRLKTNKRRPSARWYDSECRQTKRTTRQLERKYRRLRTAETLAAWRQQFNIQRRLFQSKFVTFWSTTVDACGRNPRKLWQTVNELLQPPRPQAPDKLSAEDFAACFRSKVSNIRSSTASATPPVIMPRHVPSMSSFEPVTEHEVRNLLTNTPAKSCSLDPVPTWFLKD